MSRAAKIFFGASVGVSAFTVWGVHWMQKRESDSMYLGVLRDEERVRLKAASAATSAASSSSAAPASVPITKDIPPPYKPAGMGVGTVVQPPPVVDPECQTCIISPPPDLVESQTPLERQRDREERRKEYEAQKSLAGRLEREQGVTADQARLV